MSRASARCLMLGTKAPGAAEQGLHAGRCAQHLARVHPVPITAAVGLAESMRACVAASSRVHCWSQTCDSWVSFWPSLLPVEVATDTHR